MRFALTIVVLAMLSGCTSLRLWTKPEPFDLHENTACRMDCGTCDERNPITVTTSPDSAIDAAKSERLLRDLCGERLKACAAGKQACVEALDRGKTAGAIK